MKCRLLSDAHLEFSGHWAPPRVEADLAILAGDIFPGAYDFPDGVRAELLRHLLLDHEVVYVPGNHEYYHFHMAKCRAAWADYENAINSEGHPHQLHILDNQSVMIDDVHVIGSTMWTSFGGHKPMVMMACQNGMNDYHHIKKSYEMQNGASSHSTVPITPDDVYGIHCESRLFVADELSKKLGRKRLVVTHHAPTKLSIHKEYKDRGILNEAYANDFNYEMDADAWVHGHIHNRADYVVGDCRVMANPRGYHGGGYRQDEVNGFDPTFTFDL